ncbi:hypothetical protein ACP70R_044692 [Stipagrostis hirtigluma subsp. patula]
MGARGGGAAAPRHRGRPSGHTCRPHARGVAAITHGSHA